MLYAFLSIHVSMHWLDISAFLFALTLSTVSLEKNDSLIILYHCSNYTVNLASGTWRLLGIPWCSCVIACMLGYIYMCPFMLISSSK